LQELGYLLQKTTRAIRANPKYDHILVVALSGDTAVDDIKKMSDAGMEEQLEKPLRMDSLYNILYAYSGEDEDYIEVFMTKELHGDKGLAICGGDEKFYLEILHEFVNTYADSAHKLRDLLTNSQINAADKLLLDIIGVSANIGAEQFTKAANDLKEALQDTEEQSYFTNLEQYQSHLESLTRDIKEFINR
jgi:HPt (histidine-containing phosphotransfer) domain-containing protein